MTADDFRSDPARVADLRDALNHPTLQQALLVIHDNNTVEDVDGPELLSVRELSKLAGRADVIRQLYTLATTLEAEMTMPMPDFGVKDPPPEGWQP